MMRRSKQEENDQQPKVIGGQEKKPNREKLSNLLLEYLKKHPRMRTVAFVLFLIMIPGSVFIGYYAWFKGMPLVVQWASGGILLWVPAAFALIILACLPIWALMLAFPGLGKVISLSLSAEEEKVSNTFDTVAKEEAKLNELIEGKDSAGLLPLLRYSRIQLEAYYKIGLNQTRRGFLYAVIAMWVGFFFLISGFSIYILPIEKIGLIRPQTDVNFLLIGVGAIIEFVSALFLWIYRSSTSQLTYFYNRQMYTHSVMMCFRIAESMKDADDTKRIIVEKVLERTWSLDRPEAPATGGIDKLLKKKK